MNETSARSLFFSLPPPIFPLPHPYTPTGIGREAKGERSVGTTNACTTLFPPSSHLPSSPPVYPHSHWSGGQGGKISGDHQCLYHSFPSLLPSSHSPTRIPPQSLVGRPRGKDQWGPPMPVPHVCIYGTQCPLWSNVTWSTYIHEICRRKDERSKQGQTNNKAKQHRTPKK